jgi:hypothetical protein
MRVKTDPLTSILGLVEALIVAQLTFAPNLLPQWLSGALLANSLAAQGLMTNKTCLSVGEDPSPPVVSTLDPSSPPPPPPSAAETVTPVEADKFEFCHAFTSRWEGGFVDHPADPGGRTNWGVTQATYNEYRRQKGKAPRDVKLLNQVEAKAVYRKLFWEPSRAERCVLPLALAYYDTCVNFGVNGGVRFLQEALGVTVDGRWGPQSEAAFLAKNNRDTAIKICEARIRFRHQRVQSAPSQRVFLQGWLNRDNDLLAHVRRL